MIFETFSKFSHFLPNCDKWRQQQNCKFFFNWTWIKNSGGHLIIILLRGVVKKDRAVIYIRYFGAHYSLFALVLHTLYCIHSWFVLILSWTHMFTICVNRYLTTSLIDKLIIISGYILVLFFIREDYDYDTFWNWKRIRARDCSFKPLYYNEYKSYSIKIVLFSPHITKAVGVKVCTNNTQFNKLQNFEFYVYVPWWLQCPIATAAPITDLEISMR